MTFADFGNDDSYYPENDRRKLLPSVTFKFRVRDNSLEAVSSNPYSWKEVTTWDLFADKRVIIFSLPGAFTPTCSNKQLPDFDKLYHEFKDLGIDEIYCISVNDAFVMNAWAKQLDIKNVKIIPDGSGQFTERMGMSIMKDNLGFGIRSWRYAVIADNGRIVEWFIEPGMKDNADLDPYGQTSPQNILDRLKNPQKELPF